MKTPLIVFLFPVIAYGLVALPARAAESVSLLEPAAGQLADMVQSFVDRDEIVGAELLVIHEGKSIVHRAFGFKDREAKVPMERDTFFAVRSMTKPFTGLAAQLLIDEGKLEFDAPVAKYLPSFANEKSRAITVRHLLTHRSGLPVGFLSDPTKPVGEYSGLSELADLSGARGPDFTPGSQFLYSDAGSDVLGALVSVVSGLAFEDFVQRRILDPLKLTETFPENRVGESSRRERTATRYAGMAGSWKRYWGPADPVIYSFLKGSGGLFATPRDYARFLQFWLEGGETPPAAKPLLSRAGFERALAPASRDAMNVGFADATSDYAQMWMLYRQQAGSGAAFGFGHNGSDGTFAYAFPEKNLIVCYFTQSRGNTTRNLFEAAVGHLFLKPDAAAFARLVQPPLAEGGLQEFTGLYAPDNRASSVGAIFEANGRLVFELPSRQLMTLRATEDRDRWVPERALNDTIMFQRETGRVIGLTLTRNGNVTTVPRFRPDPALPTVDELMALRARAASVELFNALLPLRIFAGFETQGRTLPMTTLVDRRGRSVGEVDLGAAGKTRLWIDGEHVWREVPGAGVVALAGAERSHEIETSLHVAMGDWRTFFADVIVLSRETFQGAEVFRVRTVPKSGFASTRLVSADTGAVVAEYGIAMVPGAGLQPIETQYSDFRRVEGVMFPFAQMMRLGSAKMSVTVSEIVPRVKIDPALLTPPVGK